MISVKEHSTLSSYAYTHAFCRFEFQNSWSRGSYLILFYASSFRQSLPQAKAGGGRTNLQGADFHLPEMGAHHESSHTDVNNAVHGTGYPLPCGHGHDKRPKDNISPRDVIFNEPLAFYCSLVLHETVYYGLTLLS